MALTVLPPLFRKVMALCFSDLTPITREAMIEAKSSKQSAMSCLNDGDLVVKVMEIATKSFEDDQNINTGYGSNLTVDKVMKYLTE